MAPPVAPCLHRDPTRGSSAANAAARAVRSGSWKSFTSRMMNPGGSPRRESSTRASMAAPLRRRAYMPSLSSPSPSSLLSVSSAVAAVTTAAAIETSSVGGTAAGMRGAPAAAPAAVAPLTAAVAAATLAASVAATAATVARSSVARFLLPRTGDLAVHPPSLRAPVLRLPLVAAVAVTPPRRPGVPPIPLATCPYTPPVARSPRPPPPPPVSSDAPSDTSEHIRAEVPPLLVAAVTVATVVALERPVLAAAEVVGEKKGGGGTFSEEGEGAAAATAACLLLFSDVVGARDAMTGAAAAAPPEAAAAAVGESPLRQDEAGRVHQGETKVAAVMAIVLMALSLRCGCRGAEETTAGRGDSGARSRLRCFFGVGAFSSSPAPSAPAGAVPVCFFWARNPTSSGSSFRLSASTRPQ
mmetsp:Transcript_24041/g.59610  ORF Transcript_24041/g.59610 Transcript_24041/m.59610 type:complete len:413 (-) Transcript_24041:183-1421(-)